MTVVRLSGPQRIELQEVLLEAFPTPDLMDDLLTGMNQNFGYLTVAGSNFRANVAAVVRDAEAGNWLVALVTGAMESVPGDPALARIRATLQPVGPPDGVDAFEVCRLSGRSLLIDRVPLRDSLRAISQPLGARILVVDGASRTGKTHTAQFISYLREVSDSFSYVPIDLEAFKRLLGPNAVIQPRDIAIGLVKKLRYDFAVDDPPPDGQWSHWVLEFCDDFEAYALADTEDRWIVIDAFNKVVVTQAAIDLIKELAVRIGASLPGFRLVLLGFDKALPPEVTPLLEREALERIGKRELIEFFIRAQKQSKVPINENAVLEAVVRVTRNLDPDDADYIEELIGRVSGELVAITQPGGGG